MLVNESVRDRVRTAITVPRAGDAVAFDAFAGELTAVPSRSVDLTGTGTLAELAGSGGDAAIFGGAIGFTLPPARREGTTVEIDLAPGQALVLLVGDAAAWHGLPVATARTAGDPRPIAPASWSVSTATATEYPRFTPWGRLDELVPLDRPDLLPRFSGTARYTASFTTAETGSARLDLGETFELATVRVNGVDLGTRIAPPYTFDIPSGVLGPDNELEVEVTNTLVKAQPDFFSALAEQDPTGLLGPAQLSAPLVVEGATQAACGGWPV